MLVFFPANAAVAMVAPRYTRSAALLQGPIELGVEGVPDSLRLRAMLAHWKKADMHCLRQLEHSTHLLCLVAFRYDDSL